MLYILYKQSECACLFLAQGNTVTVKALEV